MELRYFSGMNKFFYKVEEVMVLKDHFFRIKKKYIDIGLME